MSISQSYLLGLYGGTTGAGSQLLNTIYGNGTPSAGSSGLSPTQALQAAEKNQVAGVAQTAAQGDVKTTIAAFTKAVNGATSLSAMLSNPAVINVLLTAGAERPDRQHRVGKTSADVELGRLQLAGQYADRHTLADVRADLQLRRQRHQSVAKPEDDRRRRERYAQITWENNQDAATPGISSALAFIQQASTITSVDQLLGNATVRNVVQTAYNIPQEIAFQSLNAQENAISSKLDVKSLKDPAFVQTLAQQYLIMNNINNSATASASSSTDLTTLAVQAGGFYA